MGTVLRVGPCLRGWIFHTNAGRLGDVCEAVLSRLTQYENRKSGYAGVRIERRGIPALRECGRSDCLRWLEQVRGY